jgi:hypothetical protein
MNKILYEEFINLREQIILLYEQYQLYDDLKDAEKFFKNEQNISILNKILKECETAYETLNIRRKELFRYQMCKCPHELIEKNAHDFYYGDCLICGRQIHNIDDLKNHLLIEINNHDYYGYYGTLDSIRDIIDKIMIDAKDEDTDLITSFIGYMENDNKLKQNVKSLRRY